MLKRELNPKVNLQKIGNTKIGFRYHARAWAIVGPDNRIILSTCSASKSGAHQAFMNELKKYPKTCHLKWSQLMKDGYRIKSIKLNYAE